MLKAHRKFRYIRAGLVKLESSSLQRQAFFVYTSKTARYSATGNYESVTSKREIAPSLV